MPFEFEQLVVYQKARAFKKRIYRLTDLFPDDERFRLRLQMRKAALSMTNCLAEGQGRYTFKDRHHFMMEARGSLYELADDINDCEDLEYAKTEHLNDLRADADELRRLINGSIKYLRSASEKKATARKEA